VGHLYARMAAGSSARAVGQPGAGQRASIFLLFVATCVSVEFAAPANTTLLMPSKCQQRTSLTSWSYAA
jgi:hypothetical protein